MGEVPVICVEHVCLPTWATMVTLTATDTSSFTHVSQPMGNIRLPYKRRESPASPRLRREGCHDYVLYVRYYQPYALRLQYILFCISMKGSLIISRSHKLWIGPFSVLPVNGVTRTPRSSASQSWLEDKRAIEGSVQCYTILPFSHIEFHHAASLTFSRNKSETCQRG